MPVLVKDSNHFNPGRFHGEIDGVREALEQAAPDSWINFWELKRTAPSTRQDPIELFEKTNPQTRLLVLVPVRRVSDIKLGLRPETERSHHPWEFRLFSLLRISSRTSSQGRPSEGLAF